MKDDTKIKRYQRLSLSRRQLLEVGRVGFGSLLLPGAFAAFGANAGNAATPNDADGPITSIWTRVKRLSRGTWPFWASGRRRKDRTRRLSLISTRILDRQKRDSS